MTPLILLTAQIGVTNGQSEPWGRAARTTTAAIIGGTASVATGGKFANGAISSAVSWALNAERNIAQEEFKSLFGVTKEEYINMSREQRELAEQTASVFAEGDRVFSEAKEKVSAARAKYRKATVEKALRTNEVPAVQGDDPVVVMASTAVEIVKMLPIPGGALGTLIAQPVQGAAVHVGTKKGEEMLRNENR